MGLFNRQIKKKPADENGKPKAGAPADGHDTNGHDANGHAEDVAQTDGDTGGELFQVQTRETRSQRFVGFVREKSPHAIKELVPWVERARSTPEGRTEFVEKTKEVAWQQADNTVRAITAGMGIADTRAFFRGDPAIEKPNPRYKVHVNAFFAHIRPKYYEKSSTKFSHTWGLGYLSFYMFMLETITGVILMVFYTPSDRRAYEDIVKIMTEVPFGQLMRDLHRVGAELMVLIVVLHMTRVFLTGSFKPPRTFTWLTGVVLLILTFALSFSGYLLPWDQLAYWAVTIGTSMAKSVPPKEIVGYLSNLIMRGGDTINQNGLLRFYLMHVFALPALTVVLISVHYYRVARTHGISVPAGEEESPDPAVRKAAKERIDYLPELFTRELLWAAIATFLVIAYSAWIFHAPLQEHSDPLNTPLHTTAPWYFLWIQGLLKDAFVLPAIRAVDYGLNQGLIALGIQTAEGFENNPMVCLVCGYDSPAWQGVIIPTMIIPALFLGVPYINEWWEKFWGSKPSRQLLKNRKGTVLVAIVSTIFMLVIWYQGTPFYGVTAPPAVEIGQAFMPAEGVLPPVPLVPDDWGVVRRLGYNNLPDGEYNLADYAVPSQSNTEFERMLSAIQQEIQRRGQLWAEGDKVHGLPNPTGTFLIEQFQQNGLKRIELQVRWDPKIVTPSDNGEYNRIIFLHENSLYK
ncbi:MAG: cytochrome b N-terminal domain-containing protein [Anaerolineae bacterium]|nr:cytochrome b N-terminal domain-containing protein [Anaerolineae bacterium]